MMKSLTESCVFPRRSIKVISAASSTIPFFSTLAKIACFACPDKLFNNPRITIGNIHFRARDPALVISTLHHQLIGYHRCKYHLVYPSMVIFPQKRGTVSSFLKGVPFSIMFKGIKTGTARSMPP